MGKIRVMDVSLANKIAAGEVVESLMNVVKELTENSIDAEATSINIILKDSGIKQIKVIDDGCGMSFDDALLAFKRHATSKLFKDDDLFNINTLGFRGEALPSIASVSKLTIETCMGKEATKLYFEGGEIKKKETSSISKGTSISVEDIFYNTPARLKYLKSLYTEVSNITNYVNKMALAYPLIKFSLINDDKELLRTDGTGNLLKVINSVYGLDVTKKMLKISGSNLDYEINGYISYPFVTRGSRNAITILVNGRCVKNSEIIRCILDAYHTYVFKDRIPIVVLNIMADPFLIDVNIHPTKMDVKFSKMDTLKDLISGVIAKALEKINLIPEAKYEERPVSNVLEVKTITTEDKFVNKEYEKVAFENLEFSFSVKESDNLRDDKVIDKFPSILAIGLVHGTYIIGEDQEYLYIIDQHAANERINYEYYKREMGKDNRKIKDLLVPISFSFTASEYILLKKHFDILEMMGFSYEEFGFNTLIVRAHPSFIKEGFEYETIRKIMEIIINSGNFNLEKFNEKVAITLACKMSIKANDHISLEEMKTLIERLSKTDNPFTCPHGRPTVIKYSEYELQKMFKRVV